MFRDSTPNISVSLYIKITFMYILKYIVEFQLLTQDIVNVIKITTMAKETMNVRVWQLGWNGMVKRTIKVTKLDRTILKVDDWFSPRVGQLCINDKGNLDVCKRVEKVSARDPFKAYTRYHFKYSKTPSSESQLVDVRKGKVFKFRGKNFLPLKEGEMGEK